MVKFTRDQKRAFEEMIKLKSMTDKETIIRAILLRGYGEFKGVFSSLNEVNDLDIIEAVITEKYELVEEEKPLQVIRKRLDVFIHNMEIVREQCPSFHVDGVLAGLRDVAEEVSDLIEGEKGAAE
ncbi:hypothetical protein P9D25_10460 [Bacillus velezensis]|uniref:hypothetical protein n=1 Tax=Bacillus velezensis TaxID=492670 RepID=UPI002DBB8D51|nr:hypothetical protein [Bacillus velezensis]MEC1338073.1 hypothetical protein [Bacillus velezensis]